MSLKAAGHDDIELAKLLLKAIELYAKALIDIVNLKSPKSVADSLSSIGNAISNSGVDKGKEVGGIVGTAAKYLVDVKIGSKVRSSIIEGSPLINESVAFLQNFLNDLRDGLPATFTERSSSHRYTILTKLGVTSCSGES